VAGGEHTLVVCEQVVEDLDTPIPESLEYQSDIKQDPPRVKVVDNRHGNGLRPMTIPSLLQLVQVNPFVCLYPCISVYTCQKILFY
jgi:hypothetical protein